METLWENHGKVILVIIALASLIGLAIVMGNNTSNGIQNQYDKFEDIGNDAVDDLVPEEHSSTTN